MSLTQTAYMIRVTRLGGRCRAAPAGETMKIKLEGFDYFVLAGGIMNIAVIAVLVGYWLLH